MGKLGKKKKEKMMSEPACLFSSSSSTCDITQRDEDDHSYHEKESQDNSFNIHPHPHQDLVSYSSGQLFYNPRQSRIILTQEEGIKNKDINCQNNRQEKNSAAHKICIFKNQVNRYPNKCHRFFSFPILLILVTLSLPCFIPSASGMNPAKGAALQQQKTEQLQQKDQLIEVVINDSD